VLCLILPCLSGGCEFGRSRLPQHHLNLGGSGSVGPRGSALPASDGIHRPWRYIVIHHSATDTGSAETFDTEHRRRGWRGLGYHFVIANGNGGPDGQVQVGDRWTAQAVGAHTGGTPGNAYNRRGIGICLVGDFDRHRPTRRQLAALKALTAQLADRYGIPPENIIGHRHAPNANTQCPGKWMARYIRTTLAPVAGAPVARR